LIVVFAQEINNRKFEATENLPEYFPSRSEIL
jgi:uncharacterized SAM-dependent methyltransferase